MDTLEVWEKKRKDCEAAGHPNSKQEQHLCTCNFLLDFYRCFDCNRIGMVDPKQHERLLKERDELAGMA